MDKNKVMELCMDVRFNRSSVEGQTVEQRKAELCDLFKELMTNYDRNKYEINEIIKENVDAILPTMATNTLDVIAELGIVGHGEKKEYWVRNGKLRIDYVALGSEIRRQKIYKSKITANPEALGAACYVELDDILSGRADYFTMMIDEIANGIMEEIMVRIQNAFVAGMATAPALNKYTGVFSLAQLRSVCNTVSAYGNPVIIGTNVGLSNITSDNGFKAVMSDNMKDSFNKNGFIGSWEGRPLVTLANTFTNSLNTAWTLNNNYIYVVPVNQDRLVKVTFEGDITILEDQDFNTGQVTKKAIKKVGINVLQPHYLGLVTLV